MSIQVLNENKYIVKQILAEDVMWNRLTELLSSDTSLQQKYHFILNQNGEVIDRSAYQLAVTVAAKTGGRQNIWIDWCGWPLYWDVGTIPWRYRFYKFVRNVDPAALPVRPDESFIDFEVVGYRTAQSGYYPYKRGLHVWFDLSSSPWADPGPSRHWGWWINRHSAASISDDGRYIYSSFALRYWGGLYFYAYGDGTQGVDADTYFQFIKETIAKVEAMSPTTSAGGGGGVTGTGGGGTGGVTAGTGGGGTTPTGGTPPAGTTPPPLQIPTVSPPQITDQTLLYAGVAAVLVGAGVILLMGGGQEGA